MSDSFAWTHRNQDSLGLDLRTEVGGELFGRLDDPRHLPQ